jgi:hypothetical protein
MGSPRSGNPSLLVATTSQNHSIHQTTTDCMDENLTYLNMLQLEHVVRIAALPAIRQIESFPPGVVVADEIALDFDNWCHWALEGFAAPQLTTEQRSSLISLDTLFNNMSAEQNDDLWTEDALHHRPEWDHVRDEASRILHVFGWSIGD